MNSESPTWDIKMYGILFWFSQLENFKAFFKFILYDSEITVC